MITEIPLSDGAVLSRSADELTWKLLRNGSFIRYLNRFEREFVNSTLAACGRVYQPLTTQEITT